MMAIQKFHDDEQGIALIELVVYMVLAAIFLVLVSAMFINGWTSQVGTADRDAATAEANLVTTSLQPIRNASAVYQPAGVKTVVIAVVAVGSDSDWECRAWAWKPVLDDKDPANDHYQLRYAVSRTPIDVSDLDSGRWGEVATTTVSRGAPAPTFDVTSSTSLTYSFTAGSNDQSKKIEPVHVDGSARAQATIPGGGPCW